MEHKEETKCCEKCYKVILSTTTSSNNEEIVNGEHVQCSDMICSCHQPSQPRKIEKLENLLPTQEKVEWSQDPRTAILAGHQELLRRKVNEIIEFLKQDPR